MRCNFESKSCFSCVLGYLRLAVLGKLSYDDAKQSWFLLVGFWLLPFVIWLSLVLVGLAVSGWSLSLLWACKPVSALLGDQLSPGSTHAQRAVVQPQLLGADGGKKELVPAAPLLLGPVHSRLLLPQSIFTFLSYFSSELNELFLVYHQEYLPQKIFSRESFLKLFILQFQFQELFSERRYLLTQRTSSSSEHSHYIVCFNLNNCVF